MCLSVFIDLTMNMSASQRLTNTIRSQLQLWHGISTLARANADAIVIESRVAIMCVPHIIGGTGNVAGWVKSLAVEEQFCTKRARVCEITHVRMLPVLRDSEEGQGAGNAK